MPENAIDPIHQFNIERLFTLHPFGIDASFTNASLLMVIILGLVTILMIVGTSRRSMVPGRLQAAAEMSYEFVADTVRGTAGEEGMRFFPFVFSLFMFVLFANILGLLPFSYTVTSQIVVTFALAALVMTVVIAYGIFKHGTHFLNLFAPSGVSIFILPFIILIEVISFVARPISLSVRLFANMLAGHITLKVFGGFVVLLLGAGGAAALIAPLPMLAIIVLTAFELLVAVLQAYVFAILTCVYLNDAIHPGH
ncbi:MULTISPECIES: F0F1 ATP synthase subunit A [Lichenihabitans]|uniref:F0F1 ATP synthase subunit A n=1 Tax=Lichenihabitans TaxID=2723776 RepID=UPI0013F14B31|nr:MULTISPECIES: F0F1 ATP synthase subunit A [Lichenihabitans]UDL96339.1 F0F1 ATP synthase subunit A [Lichenihabitans sp. PAMC28606]